MRLREDNTATQHGFLHRRNKKESKSSRGSGKTRHENQISTCSNRHKKSHLAQSDGGHASQSSNINWSGPIRVSSLPIAELQQKKHSQSSLSGLGVTTSSVSMYSLNINTNSYLSIVVKPPTFDRSTDHNRARIPLQRIWVS